MSKLQKNEFEISGKVIAVGMPEPKSDKMKIRLLILLVYEGQYKSEVPIQFINDDMSLLDGIQTDDWVNVDFVLTGRRWTNKEGKAMWFGTIKGKGITKDED